MNTLPLPMVDMRPLKGNSNAIFALQYVQKILLQRDDFVCLNLPSGTTSVLFNAIRMALGGGSTSTYTDWLEQQGYNYDDLHSERLRLARLDWVNRMLEAIMFPVMKVPMANAEVALTLLWRVEPEGGAMPLCKGLYAAAVTLEEVETSRAIRQRISEVLHPADTLSGWYELQYKERASDTTLKALRYNWIKDMIHQYEDMKNGR